MALHYLSFYSCSHLHSLLPTVPPFNNTHHVSPFLHQSLYSTTNHALSYLPYICIFALAFWSSLSSLSSNVEKMSHVQIVRQNALNGPVWQSYLKNIMGSLSTICRDTLANFSKFSSVVPVNGRRRRQTFVRPWSSCT